MLAVSASLLELRDIIIFGLKTVSKSTSTALCPGHVVKVTVGLQGCLPKNHSYARRLYYTHRKVSGLINYR